jgi:CubicO group peptidase (beta-lactamase class C family)
MDRRTLLKLAATGTAATALGGGANAASPGRSTAVRSLGVSGHAYGGVLDILVGFAEEDLAIAGVPGMTLCLVDAEGFSSVTTLGWADIDRRIPVNPSQLFQIGSISKSFAALCAYRLADEGKIDLDAPLSRYLHDVPLPAEPILLQQMLSHTAGLPRITPVVPRVPDQRLWTGFTPGTNFSYSNTGYELIGMLVEKITGKPYPVALRELILEPLGIAGMKEVLQASDRANYAIGYSPLDTTGPNIAHVPLGQTQWINFDNPAGNIGSTADGMAPYLQFLIEAGRGRGKPLFSDTAAKRFSKVLEPAAAAAAIFGKGTGYASGLGIIDLDGHTAFHHTGGTWGFSSCVTVDPVAGVGCFVSVNAAVAGYRPANISKYACALMREARDGRAARRPTIAIDQVERAEVYAATYFGPDGRHFQLVVRSGCLFLLADGHEGRMQPVGEHGFLSDHPQFGSHFFDFERGGDTITAVWYGPVLYGRSAPIPQPAVPPELAPMQGVYASSDFFTGWWRSIFAQGDRLVMENIAVYRGKNILRRQGDCWHAESADNPCERIRFEAVINGVPQRLNISGLDLWRFEAT